MRIFRINPAKKCRILSTVTGTLLLVTKSFFNYKASGNNIFENSFSVKFLMVMFFLIHKSNNIHYLRLEAAAIRTNMKFKRSYPATVNKEDIHFIHR